MVARQLPVAIGMCGNSLTAWFLYDMDSFNTCELIMLNWMQLGDAINRTTTLRHQLRDEYTAGDHTSLLRSYPNSTQLWKSFTKSQRQLRRRARSITLFSLAWSSQNFTEHVQLYEEVFKSIGFRILASDDVAIRNIKFGRLYAAAPSNRSVEAKAGFDVVWFFNKEYTLYLQGSSKKPAKFTFQQLATLQVRKKPELKVPEGHNVFFGGGGGEAAFHIL
ncbi:hypothetical protein K438DRAFT_1768726 [Mycena galopus ATCC 62051]|nr:hypothetical protein K438DRAFT_1768726 [Mycena galopus ATCC 62051]